MLRRVLRVLLLVPALLWVPFALFAAIDVDVWWPIPSAVAFLPYAVVATLLVFLLCLAFRARLAALVALVGLAVLVVPRFGRVEGNAQPVVRGTTLTVATSNTFLGRADVAALMQRVQRDRIDVLALQENTASLDAALGRVGLRRQLPYAVAQPGPHASGLSVYSRWPITRVAGVRGDDRSAGGIVALPGGERLHIRSAHPYPPFSNVRLRQWRDDTLAAARTIESRPEPALVLGDFNATLDNHPLRALIDRARLRDAADETGQAWQPTWSNGSWGTLTLDHVLVPGGAAVEAVAIHDLARTDHDVVVARLRTPG